MRVEEHDYVRLRNGQTGTVVYVFHSPDTAYEVELSRCAGEMVTVRDEDPRERRSFDAGVCRVNKDMEKICWKSRPSGRLFCRPRYVRVDITKQIVEDIAVNFFR